MGRFEWSTNIPSTISVGFIARMGPIEIFYFTFVRVSWKIFMCQLCCLIVQKIVFVTLNIELQYFISTDTSAFDIF